MATFEKFHTWPSKLKNYYFLPKYSNKTSRQLKHIIIKMQYFSLYCDCVIKINSRNEHLYYLTCHMCVGETCENCNFENNLCFKGYNKNC